MMYRQPRNTKGDISYPLYTTYGNNYCSKGNKCISNLTVNDIKEICYFYNDKDPNEYSYQVQIVFKN